MEIEDSENDIRLWILSPVYEEIRRNDQIHKVLFETHERLMSDLYQTCGCRPILDINIDINIILFIRNVRKE